MVPNFNCVDVWNFLRGLKIPYCCLYDAGYTSIGGINNTKPNESLRNPKSLSGFDPAYLLGDISTERLGRPIK